MQCNLITFDSKVNWILNWKSKTTQKIYNAINTILQLNQYLKIINKKIMIIDRELYRVSKECCFNVHLFSLPYKWHWVSTRSRSCDNNKKLILMSELQPLLFFNVHMSFTRINVKTRTINFCAIGRTKKLGKQKLRLLN